jgi:hypothetical protein
VLDCVAHGVRATVAWIDSAELAVLEGMLGIVPPVVSVGAKVEMESVRAKVQ